MRSRRPAGGGGAAQDHPDVGRGGDPVEQQHPPQGGVVEGVDERPHPRGDDVGEDRSGGERSLTAIAFLVALFRARPSPFYVMDEVEAALDDTNLGRLLEIFTELRRSSQLIIITHQKFTMEAADALYGVSMRGDGITQVISQRIRGVVSAPPPVPTTVVGAPV